MAKRLLTGKQQRASEWISETEAWFFAHLGAHCDNPTALSARQMAYCEVFLQDAIDIHDSHFPDLRRGI